MPKQPVRVHIFNQSYTLLADGDPAEVETVAQQIDELMATIASRAGTGDSTRVAVLACLHLADKLRSTEAQLRTIEDKSSRIAQLLERALDDAQFENV
ncbi:MAG TPA: cell division protein ZapA [Bryobacteraceae bacterium]|nr:cell division protein ZapA [Bryobacteraceae bacterium]